MMFILEVETTTLYTLVPKYFLLLEWVPEPISKHLLKTVYVFIKGANDESKWCFRISGYLTIK